MNDPAERAALLDSPIRLLVVDIDGCLVPIEHAAYDLMELAKVAELNRLSRFDPAVPRLTILSGRPHPYVDALMQLLDISEPAIFENGAGLAVRSPYHARFRPEAERGRDDLNRLRHELERRPEVMLQPGKSASLTVFPANPKEGIIEIERMLGDLTERQGLELLIDPAHECVNVLVPGVDKGLGLRWLADETGVALSEMAGIGDSQGDLAWLGLCAVAGAPANADPQVKEAVSIVSLEEDIAAVLELYRSVIAANRMLGAR